MDIVPEKQCSQKENCINPLGSWLPATLEYFPKVSNRPCGLAAKCRVCDRARGRKYYANNKERVIKRTSEYQKAHPEQARASSKRHYYNHHEQEKARIRKVNAKRQPRRTAKYYENIEVFRAYGKAYRETHRDQISQSGKDYYRKHPEKAMERYTKRRARELEAEGHYTKADIALMYKSQKGLCWWCGKPVGDNYHIDHRVALTKGGTNWPDNLCVSCPECNRSKGNKLPHEWNGRLL